MRFYDALQMDPSFLKKMIRGSEEPKERRKLMVAIAARSVLTVLFAILMIAPAAPVFGPENSAMAVALFCILLGIRFVDFGYCIGDSLVNLAVVFLLLLIAPWAAASVNPFFAGIIHILAFFTILFMTSNRPEMGNAGIYTFAYIYLSCNPVSGELLWKRGLLTLVGYVLCGAILFGKHRKKNKDIRFKDLLVQFRLSDKKTLWQVQLALGVGLILTLGSALHLPRMMWAAFACGSILGYYSATGAQIKERIGQRIVGAVAGSLIFLVVYSFLPESMRPILGPLGGLCLGFCTDYRFKTACNCIGALFMATAIFGLHQSVVLRVVHNVAGVIFGYVFLLLFQKVTDKCLSVKSAENVENPTL